MLDLMEPETIRIEREGGVATVTLNRPEKRNALRPQDFARLGEIFEEIAARSGDRVMVLTGEGEAFSAGADLLDSGPSLKALRDGPVARAAFARRVLAPALALHRLPKPTIAAVSGIAAGGGCNLALGCDVIFAAESARFAEIFVNRGLALDYGGTWLLPRLVGLQRAKDLAFRGEPIDAREALGYGMVLEVVRDDALQKRVREYALALAAQPPIALALIKSGLNRASGWSFEEGLEFEADAQSTCLGSRDFREAIEAWIQKRPAHFTAH